MLKDRVQSVSQPDKSTSPYLSMERGIRAVHIDQAREMTALHTRARAPPPRSSGRADIGTPNSNATAITTTQPQPVALASDSTAVSALEIHTAASVAAAVSVPAKAHTGTCHNPQCTHCGEVIIPSPRSLFPIQDTPSISVNDWSVYTSKRPILSSAELDNLAETRFDFPLPEMIFGNSYVRLVNDKSGAYIEFNPLDALDSLNRECPYKVSYHEEWLESRRLKRSSLLEASEKALKENSNKDIARLTEPLETFKPYDWTYTPNYMGTVHGLNFESCSDTIPLAKLQRRDPILYYDESVLYEDELGDNGISLLSTKVRVMPTCILVLCRFFLRIDGVIFKIRDVRIYVDLELNEVMRDYREQELPYADMVARVNTKAALDPSKFLRNVEWVAENTPVTAVKRERCEGGH